MTLTNYVLVSLLLKHQIVTISHQTHSLKSPNILFHNTQYPSLHSKTLSTKEENIIPSPLWLKKKKKTHINNYLAN
jgi:hypothetical protein